MITVGLTGGVSSGKTSAAKAFKRLGAEIADADQMAHGLMKKGTREHKRIVERFGDAILDSAGEISRHRLRDRILTSDKGLQFLERTLHPGVRRGIRKLFSASRKKKGLLVIEVPLLFETGMDRMFDATVAVVAAPARQSEFAASKGMNEETIARFSRRQWPPSKKAAKADYVIKNDGSLDGLRARVKAIFSRINSTTNRR